MDSIDPRLVRLAINPRATVHADPALWVTHRAFALLKRAAEERGELPFHELRWAASDHSAATFIGYLADDTFAQSAESLVAAFPTTIVLERSSGDRTRLLPTLAEFAAEHLRDAPALPPAA